MMKEVVKEHRKQRRQEQKLLAEIAAIASQEFAERAAGELNSRKHLYGFGTYLTLLEDLKTLLYGGIPENIAFDSVQSGYRPKEILAIYSSAAGIAERF